ncbi:MAG: hypothetical protein KJ709_04090 [Nanoarchaeota archaeon]|nr:hypothetical protein [Nanoarchaeota archaeon]
MLELVERHAVFSDDLMHEATRHEEISTARNYAAHKLRGMDKEVKVELRRLKGFEAFNISKHGILWAELEIRHNIEEMLISNWLQRFPRFAVAIQTKDGCFFGEHPDFIERTTADIKDVIRLLEKSRPLSGELPKPRKNDRFYL